MIKRTLKEVTLPAHSMTLEEFGNICSALIARFDNEHDTEVSIVLVTSSNNVEGLAFESVGDMIENKNKIDHNVSAYFLEVRASDSTNGLRTLEISPPFSSNIFQTRSRIRAASRTNGWCADIIETALAEYWKCRKTFNWMYSNYFALPVQIGYSPDSCRVWPGSV